MAKRLTYDEIQQDILKARKELETANRNFEYADTEELIDICSLQIIVAQRKCDYLTKLAKEYGMASKTCASQSISAVVS